MQDEAAGEVAAVQVVVRGRVQGVGFRDFVQRRANALGVSGWVRNGDDGRSVDVYAVAARGKLEELIACLHEGPRFARVADVAVAFVMHVDCGAGFRVGH